MVVNRRIKNVFVVLIISALVVVVFFFLNGGVLDYLINRKLGLEEIVVNRDQLSDGWETLTLGHSEDIHVYKKQIHVIGEFRDRLLLNGLYELEGKVDTVFNSEWYASADSLYVQPSVNLPNDLIISYKFFYTTN